MIPVSVAVITKNEEKNIADAMESLKDFGDIVVIDAFSKDRTVEVCRRFTDRVYQHEWRGYAAQKQLAIDRTSNDWVLILDADERVTPELKAEIIDNITGNEFDGFYIPRKNFFLGKWMKHSGWWPDHTLRLFRKEVSCMQPRKVHEKVVVNGKVGYLQHPLEHFSYKSLSEFIKKMDSYSSLAADEMAKGKHSFLAFRMIFSPAFVFCKMYILRQGFMDGIHGLVLAILYSCYTFMKYAKLWEKRR